MKARRWIAAAVIAVGLVAGGAAIAETAEAGEPDLRPHRTETGYGDE